MRTAAIRAGHRICWHLKQVSGEAKWNEHLRRAHNEGLKPMSRRDLERHRPAHEKDNPRAAAPDCESQLGQSADSTFVPPSCRKTRLVSACWMTGLAAKYSRMKSSITVVSVAAMCKR